MTKEIQLTSGGVSIVDDADFEVANLFMWQKEVRGKTVYARGVIKRKHIYLHRFLMRDIDCELIDHINGNGLDNRRCNLRPANHSENHANQDKNLNNTSGYKGVIFHKRNKNWVARISSRHIGCYDTAEEAALAYNNAAIERYGKFARINEIK